MGLASFNRMRREQAEKAKAQETESKPKKPTPKRTNKKVNKDG